MGLLFVHLVALLVCLMRFSVATITLTSDINLGSEGSFECGSPVRLTCTIEPFADLMTWQVDGITVAECAPACSTQGSNYGFGFDTTNGEFVLTIPAIQFNDNGKVFECDDGTLHETITAEVKVLPGNDTSVITNEVISSSDTTTESELKATTGCVYPSEGVTVSWYYFKAGMTPVLYTSVSEPVMSINDSTCTSSGDCAGAGVTQVSSALTLVEDANGEDYYFQAVIRSGDSQDAVIVTTSNTFKLTDDDNNSTNTNTTAQELEYEISTNLIIGLAIAGAAVLVTGGVLFLFCHAIGNNPENQKIIK